jgi:hypothetical protein
MWKPRFFVRWELLFWYLLHETLCFKVLKILLFKRTFFLVSLRICFVLFSVIYVISGASDLYPVTITALKENINPVGTQYLQILYDSWNGKMVGDFKTAMLGSQGFMLVKVHVVMDCLNRTQISTIYTTISRIYRRIQFPIPMFVFLLNMVKYTIKHKFFCYGL